MIERHEPEVERRPRFRNHRLRRGIYLLPSSFTVANLLCGYYAVLATFKGGVMDLDNAAIAIGFAILFDMLDGRVARAMGVSSEFGKQLDSLADVVSFGIAPAILAFAWGVHGLREIDTIQAHHVYQLGWLVSFAFVICCAWRLARFNIHGMAGGGMRYFVGLPTPPAAGMIAATVHAVRLPVTDWRASSLWLVMVLGLAVLMVTRLRYYSFKDIQWGKRQPSVRIVLIAVLAGAVVYYSQVTLFLMGAAYVLSGLAIELLRMLRHRHTANPA